MLNFNRDLMEKRQEKWDNSTQYQWEWDGQTLKKYGIIVPSINRNLMEKH